MLKEEFWPTNSKIKIKKMNLNIRFKLQIPYTMFHYPNTIVWYTDGSWTDGAQGKGILGPRSKINIVFGKSPTVLKAEIDVINACVFTVYIYENCIGTQVYAYIFRQLKRHTFNSSLVWECYLNLQKLVQNNRVTIVWNLDNTDITNVLVVFIASVDFCGINQLAEFHENSKDTII